MTQNTITAAYNALLEAAETITTEGVEHARRDDPHRFSTLPGEFDDGKARRRLVIDYLGEGKVAVGLEFVGTREGEPIALQVFGTVLQGPDQATAH